MYYGARYYLPELRRFISADTIVPDPGNPQAFNRYAYVYNNPIKLVDPTGHETDCTAGICDIEPPPPPPPPPEESLVRQLTKLLNKLLNGNLGEKQVERNQERQQATLEATSTSTSTPSPTSTSSPSATPEPTPTRAPGDPLQASSGWYYPTSSGEWTGGPDDHDTNQSPIDFANTADGNVYAAASGEVVVRWDETEGGDWGNTLIVRYNEAPNNVSVPSGKAIYVATAHMATMNVDEGDRVTPGQPLGTIGATGTGDITGPHVHAEVAIMDDDLTSTPGGNPLTFATLAESNPEDVGNWAWWGKNDFITEIWPNTSE